LLIFELQVAGWFSGFAFLSIFQYIENIAKVNLPDSGKNHRTSRARAGRPRAPTTTPRARAKSNARRTNARAALPNWRDFGFSASLKSLKKTSKLSNRLSLGQLSLKLQ
jgi:hypothetical protein